MERIGFSLWVSFFICFFCNVFAGLISTLMPTYLLTVVRDLSGVEDIPRISGMIVALYIAGWTVGGFTWGFISDKLVGRRRSHCSYLIRGPLATTQLRYIVGMGCGR
ncbi:MAG: hypothetical protein WDO15_29880 [Bacteroidota bacterium]